MTQNMNGTALGLVLVGAMLVGTACDAPRGAHAAPGGSVQGLPDRDVALARRLIAEGAVVIDTRSEGEWEGGHHAKAHLLPVGEIDARMGDVAAWTGGKKDTPIVLYCASGRRASVVKQRLLAAGYTQVTNVGGWSDLR